MKHGTAGNLALALALLAWPLCVLGVFIQAGSYRPGMEYEATGRAQFQAGLVLALGILSVCVSTWLAGYSFPGAKTRATFASVLCAVLVLHACLMFMR